MEDEKEIITNNYGYLQVMNWFLRSLRNLGNQFQWDSGLETESKANLMPWKILESEASKAILWICVSKLCILRRKQSV